MIDVELNSTSVIEDKMTQSEDEESQPLRPPVSSTDEEENLTAEQSESPTHTVSSSNGLETVGCFLWREKNKVKQHVRLFLF